MDGTGRALNHNGQHRNGKGQDEEPEDSREPTNRTSSTSSKKKKIDSSIHIIVIITQSKCSRRKMVGSSMAPCGCLLMRGEKKKEASFCRFSRGDEKFFFY